MMLLKTTEVKAYRYVYLVSNPTWIDFAIEGQKIEAIKALRATAGLDGHNNYMTLKHAKQIVENFIDHLKIETTNY